MAERNTLFREEAILHKSDRTRSAPVIQQSNLLKVQGWLCMLFLLAALLLLANTNYKETEVARGVLQPSRGTQKIGSPFDAMVDRIYVEEGQAVQQGQVLASLSSSVYDYSGKPRQHEEVRQLQTVLGSLQEQSRLQEQIYTRSKDRNLAVARNLRSSKDAIGREAELLAEKQKLSARNLNSLEQLLRSSNISQAHYDQQHTVHLNLLLQREELNRRIQQIDHELNDAVITQDFTDFEFENTRLQLQRDKQQLDYQIHQIRNREQLTVVAKEDGVIAAVAAQEGMPVHSNQLLFYINPETDKLQAIIYASARVQGKLSVGQTLLLSYDAFSYQLFGRYPATISVISQASLDPREHLLSVPGINEPVFKIVAELEQEYVEGSDLYHLQPGMLLTADFVIAEMSLLSFIFKPLLRLRGKVW